MTRVILKFCPLQIVKQEFGKFHQTNMARYSLQNLTVYSHKPSNLFAKEQRKITKICER